MDRPDQTTHFGFRDVPLEDKQTLVNDVFHSVALALRPDERSDVGGPASGLERPDDQRAQSAARRRAVRAARRCRRHRRHRVSRRQGGGPRLSRHRLRHQFRHARRSAASAPRRGISTIGCRLSRAMPRRWRFPTAPSTPTPSRSASATCRGSIWRSAKHFACCKPGSRFLCLEFSTVDVPGLDRIYDLFSFKVIPPLGRAVTGDAESYRYLVESIRKFPKPNAFADMIRAAGFSRASTGKAFPAASWRCIRAGVCDFCHNPHRAAGPRRFRVRARRRVRRRRSEPGAAARPTRASHRPADRAPRRQIRPAAVARADAARTRPISSSDSSWRPGPTWSAS